MGRRELRIAGFGGQGVVLAGQIVGQAVAVYDNQFAAFTQNYGPEARGGNSSAQVVIRESNSDWPETLNIDLLVILSQEGYTTWLKKVDAKAAIIYDNYLIRNVDANRAQQYAIPATKIADELGVPQAANMVMMGALAAITGLVTIEDLSASIPKRGKGPDVNAKALDEGFRLGNLAKEQVAQKV